MKTETYNEQLLYRLAHRQENFLLLIVSLAAFCGLCLILFGLFDKPTKTAGFFLKNPVPMELIIHTNTEEGDLVVSDKKMVGELRDLIYNRKLKINSSANRKIEHIHLAWGQKGNDFDILEDGRIRIFVLDQLVTDKSLTYRIALRIRMVLSNSKRVYYESEPDKKTYLKAMELLKAAENT